MSRETEIALLIFKENGEKRTVEEMFKIISKGEVDLYLRLFCKSNQDIKKIDDYVNKVSETLREIQSKIYKIDIEINNKETEINNVFLTEDECEKIIKEYENLLKNKSILENKQLKLLKEDKNNKSDLLFEKLEQEIRSIFEDKE